MRRRSVLLYTAIATILIAVLIVACLWKPLLIAHHRKGLTSARDRMEANCYQPTRLERLYGRLFIPDPFVENWGLLGHYGYHVRRLVELGAMERREFQMTHVAASSDEASALMEAAWVAFPDGYASWSQGSAALERLKITVCDEPDQMVEWERFLSAHDVPDFRDRFMTPGDETGRAQEHDAHSSRED